MSFETITAGWPIFAAFVGLVYWLARAYAEQEQVKEKLKDKTKIIDNLMTEIPRMAVEIESLKEKVKVLYSFHNDKNK